jgi:uncharacterized SAM-dependent methyltransferase
MIKIAFVWGLQLLLCADLWKSPEVLHSAYHDAEGVTEEFICNGLSHALSRLRTPYARDPHDWSYEVVVNHDLRQVKNWQWWCLSDNNSFITFYSPWGPHRP